MRCALVEEDERRLSFDFEECAVLDDGSLLTLRTGRGYSTSINQGNPWRHESVASMTQSVFSVLQPEIPGQWYSWMPTVLDEYGVTASEAGLRSVPFEVKLDREILQRIADQQD